MAADKVLEPIAVDWMKHNPVRVAILFFKKLGTLYSAFSPTITDNEQAMSSTKIITAVSFYPVLILALVGLVKAPGRNGVFLRRFISDRVCHWALIAC